MSDLKEGIKVKMGLKPSPVKVVQATPPASASEPPPEKKESMPSLQISCQQAAQLGLRPLVEILSTEEIGRGLARRSK